MTVQQPAVTGKVLKLERWSITETPVIQAGVSVQGGERMRFDEFEERIKETNCPDGMRVAKAYLWFSTSPVPQRIISLGETVPETVRIPERVIDANGHSVPVISFVRNVFAGRKEITDIILPPTIEGLPEGAFSGCASLERITIPRKIRYIGEGTFEGCTRLKDVYYEGTPEEWRSVEIVHDRHEIEFGKMKPGTPVQEIVSERMIHVPGNEALLTADLHFRCRLSEKETKHGFSLFAKEEVTELFRIS